MVKVVILAGGLGRRLSEETAFRPKPMVEIGGKPILWHIMKIYSAHGIERVRGLSWLQGLHDQGVLCELLPAHVRRHASIWPNNAWRSISATAEPWRVTLVDTGDETMTGGRIKRVMPYRAATRPSASTYGDGVADVDMAALLAFHRPQAAGDVTAVRPAGRFGAIASTGDMVTSFKEKPHGDGGWINGGFFLLSPAVLDLIAGDATIWEHEPLERLVASGQSARVRASRILAADGHAARQAHSWKSLGGGRGPVEGLVTDPAFLARPTRSFSRGILASREPGPRSVSRSWVRACTGYALPPTMLDGFFNGVGRRAAAVDAWRRRRARSLGSCRAAMAESRPKS